MSGHTAVWREYNESQREYYRALSEQSHAQERFMPMDEEHDPESPGRIPDPLTLEVMEEFSVIDRRVHETRQRYARAINALNRDL